jgi:hypothetical protein
MADDIAGFDHALVYVNGEPIEVITGTSFRATGSGDILVLPPKSRVEFRNGVQVPYQPGPNRLVKANGDVMIVGAHWGEE